jgi:uncharacterized protein (DUF2126 family)
MLDGRHTGTGGGNHIVLGGATPADSPFLRRPDLLRSLLAYWHNHPSLSYLFSGLFIGPTSQAPRIDEARNDSLYELEIAFRQLPAKPARRRAAVAGRPPAAQPADRRHRQHAPRRVLHRQAVLARRPTGRLGPARDARLRDAAARAHEPRAAAAAARAGGALLAQALPPARLVRWGTELHDRFMLPHFVAAGFRDVIDELRAPAIAFEAADGSRRTSNSASRARRLRAVRGIELELRQALEPWHVMGEEGAPAARCATSIPRWSACRSR